MSADDVLQVGDEVEFLPDATYPPGVKPGFPATVTAVRHVVDNAQMVTLRALWMSRTFEVHSSQLRLVPRPERPTD
jgi:hypothetical protein